MSTKRHILVIRLSAMGDVAMTVPVITAVLKQNPTIKITVLTRAFFKPMFSQLANTDVFEADVKGRHKGVLGLWKLYTELKQLGITEVADLHNVLRSTILKTYFSWGSMPFIQIDKGRKEKKNLTRLASKILRPLKTTPERYADVFRKLGLTVNLSKEAVLQREKLSDKVLELVGNHPNKWIGIAPFAAFSGKMYPLELMEKVLEEVNNTSPHTILLFGGGEIEKKQLEIWATKFSSCTNMAGVLPFTDELALISNLDVMLAMDSGNAHLAALYGIPTITLWGVTHPYAGFAPFGQEVSNCLLSDIKEYPFIPTSVYGNKFPAGYEKVMHTIAPTDVTQKIFELLVKTE
ncbi:glycosyltransferase family 9 protein [uncultured Maribacter sp.]|uniref:glycosyltransferase family 9 protein n=1 Tax=uncultured Maribacter sp. TaxID=431308 RepID=UPI00261074F1|nr:glycosyltransferase family 9 protein [uncultured Maribacter sp.]